ncbi:amino acid permease-domain-containing protein [Pyronema omphalodes]|nr:amino acid permease-domain-containing protein [Pyronema omphalodes]
MESSSFPPPNRQSTAFSTERKASTAIYESDIGEHNRILLDRADSGFEDNKPVISHYAETDKLGFSDTASLLINTVIGGGIFSTPISILQGTESVGISLIFWLLGALIAFAGLCVNLELGLTIPRRRRYIPEENRSRDDWIPRSGGEKNYLEWIYKRPAYLATCVYAVVYILLAHTAGNAIFFARYIFECFNIHEPEIWLEKLTAIAALTVVCGLHGLWRNGGIWASNVLAGFKVLILLFIIIIGFAVSGGAFKNIDPATKNFNVRTSFKTTETNPYEFVSAMFMIRFSYSGFESVNYVMSDIKRPQSTLKRSTFSALSLVSVLYILTNISYFCVVPSSEILDIKSDTRMAVIFFDRIFGPDTPASRILPAFCAISAFGNLLSNVFTNAKVKQEIAKEGILPFSKFWSLQFNSSRLFLRWLYPSPARSNSVSTSSTVSVEFGQTPVPALFLHWIVSVLLILVLKDKDSFAFLNYLRSYAIDACIGLLLAAGLLYKRYSTGGKWAELRGFKPWLGPVIPLFYLLSNIYLVFVPWVSIGNASAIMQVAWYLAPTVTMAVFAGGVAYWGGLKVVELAIGKKLKIERTPYFDRDNYIMEEVRTAWVVAGAENDPQEDPVDLY